jgi:hypothetical protein
MVLPQKSPLIDVFFAEIVCINFLELLFIFFNMEILFWFVTLFSIFLHFVGSWAVAISIVVEFLLLFEGNYRVIKCPKVFLLMVNLFFFNFSHNLGYYGYLQLMQSALRYIRLVFHHLYPLISNLFQILCVAGFAMNTINFSCRWLIFRSVNRCLTS